MSETGSYQEAVERMAASDALAMVRPEMFVHLLQEMGAVEPVLQWLAGLAEGTGRPIALHLEGITTFLSPPGWSNERLQGWAAGHAEELEEAFGRAVDVFGPGDDGEGLEVSDS